MAYCSAILKSEKYCTSKAKYILKEYNQLYCKTHALSHSNQKMNTEYKTIESVPSLEELVTQNASNDCLADILADIYHIHGYRMNVISKKKVRTGDEILVINSNNLSDKYILKVSKSYAHIDQAISTSSVYASILTQLTKPICVPIVSYDQKNHGPCLIRGWKYNHWYYELSHLSYPVLLTDHKKLILTLLNLIEYSQQRRIVHGCIELRNLVQLKAKRISTTVFESLKNAMFWEGRHGQTVECDEPLEPNITFDAMTCANRMNKKLHPCRYDDYESLLYFTLHLLDIQLPWIGLTVGSEIATEKNNFLNEHACNQNALGKISKMIIDSHIDDRPDYTKLITLFSALVE